MSRDVREGDWRVFHELRGLALERFYAAVLEDIAELARDEAMTFHARYGAIYELLQREDRKMAAAFDGPRRSTMLLQPMLLQLRMLIEMGLVWDEESARLSDEVRSWIRSGDPGHGQVGP